MTDFRPGTLLSSELCIIKIVNWGSNWYSCNNRARWCFREPIVIAREDHVALINFAFLHGLTTHARVVSLWSSSRCLCAWRAIRRLSTAKGCTTTICQRKVELAVSPAQACWFLMWRRMSSWTHTSPYMSSFSTMGIVFTVKSFISTHNSCTDIIALDLVERNTIRPTKIDILHLSTRAS